MNKPMSLLFAVVAVLFLVATGISLSFEKLWTALFFLVAFVLEVGAGFVIKARLRKKNS